MARPLTFETTKINAIVELYASGKNVKEIATIFNVTPPTITRYLRKENIKIIRFGHHSIRNRKYTINHNFFEYIDSEEKAYILGLLYADGYMQKNHRVTMLTLVGDDEKILLEKIKNAIEYSGPIRSYKNAVNNLVHVLQLSSPKLYKDIVKQGCYNKKSLTLTFPTEDQVPLHLIHHFVRGYFDGDGSIMFNPNKRKTDVAILGTQQFCNSLRQSAIRYIGSVGSVSRCMHTEFTFSFRISGSYQFERFFNWIYNNAHIFLKRKHDIFTTFLLNKMEFRRKNYRSKFNGVSKNAQGYITSSIWRDNKNHWLGSFKTELEAAKVHDKWCVDHDHNLHKLNFPIENYKPKGLNTNGLDLQKTTYQQAVDILLRDLKSP